MRMVDESKKVLEGGWGGGTDFGFAAAGVCGWCEFFAAAAF
jgi:hypothetical protein